MSIPDETKIYLVINIEPLTDRDIEFAEFEFTYYCEKCRSYHHENTPHVDEFLRERSNGR